MPLNGLHGSFAWSCAAERCDDDPATSCGRVYIAGVDKNGDPHAYGDCVEDILTHPELYADEHIILCGTHTLTMSQRIEVYGDEPEELAPPERYETLTMGDDDTSDFVTVAIGALDPTVWFLVSLNALTTMHQHPEQFTDHQYELHGTHHLPDEVLDDFFGPGEY